MPKKTNKLEQRVAFWDSFYFRVVLEVVLVVLFILVSTLLVIVSDLDKFSNYAWRILEKKLTSKIELTITNRINSLSWAVNNLIKKTEDRVNIGAEIIQVLIDNYDDGIKLGRVLEKQPHFADCFRNDNVKKSGWQLCANTNNVSLLILGDKMLKQNGVLKSNAADTVAITSVMNLFLPAINNNFFDITDSTYVLGIPEIPFYRDIDESKNIWKNEFKNSSSMYKKTYRFWTVFYPALAKCWQKFAINSKTSLANENMLVVTPPVVDSILNKEVISLFKPVWSKNNKTNLFATVCTDFEMRFFEDLLREPNVSEISFIFIALSDGNVVAINREGEKILGLSSETNSYEWGYNLVSRKLANSKYREVACFSMPKNDSTYIIDDVSIPNGSVIDKYFFAFKRLDDIKLLNLTNCNGKLSFKNDNFVIGFAIKHKNVYSSLYAIRSVIESTVKNILYTQIAVGACLLILSLCVSILFAKWMVNQLLGLVKAANKVQQKDYVFNVEIKGRDEFGKLAYAFNSMAVEIEKYIKYLEDLVLKRTRELRENNQALDVLNNMLKNDNRRLSAELSVARKLQLRVLPRQQELKNVSEHLDIVAYMSPAEEVGGDYYDVMSYNSLIKIGIGDVTGHGLESGVIMIMVQSIAKTLMDKEVYNPVNFLVVLNKVLYRNIKRINTDKSLSLAFIDYKDNKITLSGQHEEIVVVRNSGIVLCIDTSSLGFPIGMLPDVKSFISTQQIDFNAGDTLVLFTDGLTEAENENRDFYGIERLCNVLRENSQASAIEMKNAVLKDLTAFIGSQKILDDITLLVIRCV